MNKNSSILIKNADYIVTMDLSDRVLREASIFIEGSRIQEVDSKKTRADTIIDGRGKIVLPGFVNCHHHMFQCGLRGKPELQNQKIDKWIAIVCDYTAAMDEELMYYSSLANMAELLLYGCTTTTDMLYIFPKGKKNFFAATIRAAHDIGIRFHPYRGSMSLSKKDGALFPDAIVQDSEAIALETENLIKKYHDDSDASMLRIGIAPCTIFTNTKEDFENAASLSKKYNVNLQTHLSESEFENEYSINKFKKRPYQYLSDLGWQGERVSFTHCIHVNTDEISTMSATKTNVVHCPISNARKPIGESGVAPIWEMLDAKLNVGVGVDGSAGNDSSNMLEELRWVRTIQGTRKVSTYLKPDVVFRMGTMNGAKLLDWDKIIGSIEVGKTADLGIFQLNSIESSGFMDPITALISTQTRRAETVIINGRTVVDNKHLTTMSEQHIVQNIRKIIKNQS